MYDHQPVMLGAVLQTIAQQDKMDYLLDGTVGLGGHLLDIMSVNDYRLKHVVAVDIDPVALKIAQERLGAFAKKINFVCDNFKHVAKNIHEKVPELDCVLLDLGVSSMQLDDPLRGFSFKHDVPLNMKMGAHGVSARSILNNYSEQELAHMFETNADMWWGKRLAKKIVLVRKQTIIATTKQFVDIILSVMPHSKNARRIHPATLPFQALRIEVNDEISGLEESVINFLDILSPGGVMMVLSFHSIEDRIIKRVFRDRVIKGSLNSLEGPSESKWELLTKKPKIATPQDIDYNPRSRSVKLRMIKRIR